MPNDSDSVLSYNHSANSDRHHSHRSTQRNYTYSIPNLKPIFSLGWELEANHRAARVPSGIDIISDGSVDGDGTEYVVLPSVTRSPRFVLGLLKDLVHSPKLNTDKSCGFHIHMSIQNATLPKLRQWALATEFLAKEIEDGAFTAVPEARQVNQYCKRIQLTESGTNFSADKYSNSRRYHWLNTVEMFRPNGIRTIEVRLLGNTHRWKYLLAWSTFSLMLAREGWNCVHEPFKHWNNSIQLLSDFLRAIELDIKPLSKKHEPVPAWVYSNLKHLGIDFTAFDRPMKKLVQSEADISGTNRVFYSDNQLDVPNVEEDSEHDSCPCGCGEDFRCDSQIHSDGDCDNNHCLSCHEERNCASNRCNYCRQEAHDNDTLCSWSNCSVCNSQRRIGISNGGTPVIAVTSVPVVTADVPFLELRRGYAYITRIVDLNTIANSLLDCHEEALSMDREHNNNSIVTEPVRGCNSVCTGEHGTAFCLLCNSTWYRHTGHTCVNGNRGSFPMGGR